MTGMWKFIISGGMAGSGRQRKIVQLSLSTRSCRLRIREADIQIERNNRPPRYGGQADLRAGASPRQQPRFKPRQTECNHATPGNSQSRRQRARRCLDRPVSTRDSDQQCGSLFRHNSLKLRRPQRLCGCTQRANRSA
jgi:hypothetical protein